MNIYLLACLACYRLNLPALTPDLSSPLTLLLVLCCKSSRLILSCGQLPAAGSVLWNRQATSYRTNVAAAVHRALLCLSINVHSSIDMTDSRAVMSPSFWHSQVDNTQVTAYTKFGRCVWGPSSMCCCRAGSWSRRYRRGCTRRRGSS